jgi:hypothetical protein
MREQYAQSWSFLALPAASHWTCAFCRGVFVVKWPLSAASQNQPFWAPAKASAEEPMPIVNEATLIKQAAAVLTGDAQKLVRLVSRELFVKPAKEKPLRLVLAARNSPTKSLKIASRILLGSMSPVSAASTA